MGPKATHTLKSNEVMCRAEIHSDALRKKKGVACATPADFERTD
jgi:hypothetical protein